MNKYLKSTSLLAAAAMFAGSTLNAATTDPVGYVTLTVNGSSVESPGTAFTPLAVSVENAVIASGTLSEDPSSVVATNSAASYTPSAFAGVDSAGNATHYLQFVSDGLIVDITANDATTITTGTDLTGLASNGDAYVVKKHLTISDIFGAANSAGLTSGGDFTTSDLVYVMSSDGAGTYASYYYQTDSLGFLGGDGWRLAGDTFTDYADVIVGPDDGLLISRDTVGDIDIVIAGSVNVIDHQRDLPSGFSLVSYPFPVDVSLDDSNIYTSTNGYVSGGDFTTSDLVFVLGSDGAFTTYYRQTDSLGFLGGDGWRIAGDTFSEVGTTVIPANSSIIIQHTGAGLAWADVKPF